MNEIGIEKVRHLLAKRKLEAVLVHSNVNKKYFGALSGSGVYLLISQEAAWMILDGRYEGEAIETTSGFQINVVPKGSYIAGLVSILREKHITQLAVESSALTISEYDELKTQSLNINLWENELAEIRSIKLPCEIEKIKAACALTDEVFTEILPKIHVGMKEYELSALITYLCLNKGASSMAFDSIITSGNRTAYPHGRPTSKTMQSGEFVMIDFGVTLDDYQSDMTRTIVLGSATAEMKTIYETVLAAQLAGIEHVKVGKTGQEVDAAARRIIEQAGYGEYFSHGLGHGIGRGGDLPILNPTGKMMLENYMVMSCEPGIYVPNLGGVRIEDDVALIDNVGTPLNKSSKKLLVLEG
ncbi:aminopeptidase P family protein [Pseudolactococcus reticulitermitis]|uniref:Aminopeptidase n=1 Tax=Pseudolactococcus reticulitermitis TaxID=2025039 RepID=A0A224X9G1_9LACT|nr:Xaa-Pro peptidase family protein [Lactococcus reticulitermitis]GAX46612.1 aminopeptidase [Lactococcus reticulitermitis]